MNQNMDTSLNDDGNKITPAYLFTSTRVEVNKLNLNHFRVNDKALKTQYHRLCTVDQKTVQLLTKYNIKPELYRVDEMMGLLEVLNRLTFDRLNNIKLRHVKNGFEVLYNNFYIGKVKYQSSDHIAEFNVYSCTGMVAQLLDAINHIEQTNQ